MAGATFFVCTINAGKPKWSRYVFPWPISDFAQLNNLMYLRHGDTIGRFDEDAVDDEGVNFTGLVQWPWLDCGPIGASKMMTGFDLVGVGTCKFSIGFNQDDPTAFTADYACDAETMVGPPIPLPVTGPTLSPRLTFDGGQKWELEAVNLYVTAHRGQP